MVVRRKPLGKKASDAETSLRVSAGDPINEAVVIVAVIEDEKVRGKYLPSITPDYFFSPKHASIWSAMQEMHRKQLEYSIETLKQIGGKEFDEDYLEELLEDRKKNVRNIKFHVEALMWDRARVELARGPLTGFLEAYRDPKTDPATLRGLLGQCQQAITGYGSQQFLRDGKQLAREQDVELTRLREGIAVYPFGIDALDFYNEKEDKLPSWSSHFKKKGKRVPRLIPGTAPGMFSVVTGLSGTGKTTTSLRAILNMVKSGRKVLVGAWEIDSGMTARMMAGFSLGYHRTDLMVGNFDEQDQKALIAEIERLSEFVRFFELPFGKTRGEKVFNDRNLDLIHQVVSDSGCDVFVADLLKKAMREASAEDEEWFITRTSAIAQQTRCHIIALHQLKGKAVEASRDKIPRRDLLKGSSAWYEVPDLVIAWHRPAMWKNLPDDTLQAYIWKQRYGEAPIAVEMDYDPEYAVIGEGRTIEVKHEDPGENSSFEDDFMSGGRKSK